MLKYLFLSIYALISYFSWGSHMAGGHFEYEYLGVNNYLIRFYFLRDCGGTDVSAPVLYMQSESCEYACTSLGEMSLISTENADYGCGTECGDAFSYELYKFEKEVTMPFSCTDWKFNVKIANRNSVTQMESDGLYYNYILINTDAGVVNHSPVFLNFDILLGCLNQYSLFNNQWVDGEGDEVLFSFQNPQGESLMSHCESTDLNYLDIGGHTLSAANPFTSSTGSFDINSSTGNFGFTPVDFHGSSYFSLKMQEYRDGVLLSETLRDGQIIIKICPPNEEIEIGNWSETGSNIVLAPRVNYSCFDFSVTADAPISSIIFPNLSEIFTPELTGIGTENVTVSICLGDELPVNCNDSIFVFDVIASTGTCTFTDTKSKNFILSLAASDFCNEYRFFTNRSPDGIPFPTYAKASNTIWVGDNMPVWSGIDAADMGEVIITEDFILEAGVEIVLPSCSGTSCVTLHGGVNQTLRVGGVSCSPECPRAPLEVNIDKHFKCGNEKIEANVTSGYPPYSYRWVDTSGTVLSTTNELFIHDTVSQNNWNDTIKYELYIEDVNGDSYAYAGSINGTKRFYEPITNNMFLYTHAAGHHWHPDSTYLYAYNPLINEAGPFVIYDDQNTTPPYYGATKMDLWIVDRWGHVQREQHINLEDDLNDWSIDNYELYWDGTPNNTGDGVGCLDGTNLVYGDYYLEARNCVFPVHKEIDKVLFADCWIGDFSDSIWTAMTPVSDFGGIEFYRGKMNMKLQENNFNAINDNPNNAIDVYPNPAEDFIIIKGEKFLIQEIIIYDLSGKIYIKQSENTKFIDISVLESGSYLLKIKTSKGIFHKKLIIQ